MTFNPTTAKVMTRARARGQGQMLLGSKVKSGNWRTDEWTRLHYFPRLPAAGKNTVEKLVSL